MRKSVFLVAVVALVVCVGVSAWAQEAASSQGVCCKAPGGETTHYARLGKCPAGTTQVSLAECGIAEPTPIPTVVVDPTPTPVPTPWEPPKEKEVPWLFTWLLGILANKFTLPIAFGSVVIALVAGYKQLLALFGGKLSPRGSYIAAGFLSFMVAMGDAVADGKIAGQEWVILLTTFFTAAAAIFGYKLLFSGEARKRIGK